MSTQRATRRQELPLQCERCDRNFPTTIGFSVHRRYCDKVADEAEQNRVYEEAWKASKQRGAFRSLSLYHPLSSETMQNLKQRLLTPQPEHPLKVKSLGEKSGHERGLKLLSSLQKPLHVSLTNTNALRT